jgi:hypothetical protein
LFDVVIISNAEHECMNMQVSPKAIVAIDTEIKLLKMWDQTGSTARKKEYFRRI